MKTVFIALLIMLLSVTGGNVFAGTPTPGTEEQAAISDLPEDMKLLLQQSNDVLQDIHNSLLESVTSIQQQMNYQANFYMWELAISAFQLAITIMILFALSWGNH